MTDRYSVLWSTGRFDGADGKAQLLFGRMHEDWAIEADVFPPGSRVFCVASAGCTALARAELGYSVTAVDINPMQIAYVQERFAGGAARDGLADIWMVRLRRIAQLLTVREHELERFLLLDEPKRQLNFWHKRIRTPLLRSALAVVLNRLLMRGVYSGSLLSALPARLDRVLLQRIEGGLAIHPNATNPYIWRMLLGRAPVFPVRSAPVRHPPLLVAEAAEYLQTCSPDSFDCFSLSNILDGAPAAYRRRLFSAMRHAAAPGACFVLRSFAEPATQVEAGWAARDRNMIWGGIRVGTLPAPSRPRWNKALTTQEVIACSTC